MANCPDPLEGAGASFGGSIRPSPRSMKTGEGNGGVGSCRGGATWGAGAVTASWTDGIVEGAGGEGTNASGAGGASPIATTWLFATTGGAAYIGDMSVGSGSPSGGM